MKHWDEASFFEAISPLSPVAQTAIRTVYQAARDAGLGIRWGKGARSGSFNVVLPAPCDRAMITVLTNGNSWFNMVWMYGGAQADSAHRLLRTIAQQIGISEQYMKQPAVGPDRWTPKLDQIVDAIRIVASTSP